MMRKRWIMALLIGVMAAPGGAQIGLPNIGGTVGSALGSATGTLDRLGMADVAAPIRSVAEIARDRTSRLTSVLQNHRDVVEADEHGDPARRGVVLMLDADKASLDAARQKGFAVGNVEAFGNLGLSAAELTVPPGMSLSMALATLRKLLPDKTITADQLHFLSGTLATTKADPAQVEPIPPIRTPIGMIDSGVGPAVTVREAKGFATGAPRPADHGTAIASLLRHAGVQTILSADVYGSDPAGCGALAIVRSLDWLVGEHVPVISISLTGPANPLLERAVMAANRQSVIVAAVGNDGPAAPPAFPASYPGVLAVTAVDGHDHALIEAGRPLHLDYAAPGTDMKAMDARGHWHGVRGTSFAAPLVAARAAAMADAGQSGPALCAALDREARDLGAKGPDPLYGHGLLCGLCAPR